MNEETFEEYVKSLVPQEIRILKQDLLFITILERCWSYQQTKINKKETELNEAIELLKPVLDYEFCQNKIEDFLDRLGE